MPWFPDFVAAAELARQERRTVGQADPVAQYLKALGEGDTKLLESVWPGKVVIYDPRAGEIEGHRNLRQFVRRNQVWLSDHEADAQVVASTRVGDRAVVELLAQPTLDGEKFPWPIAVVAESPNDRSVIFRTYCSQWPVDRRRHVRPPILEPTESHPGEVVGRYLNALDAGDVDEIMRTFESDGYFRESIGPNFLHRGTRQLHSYFSRIFGAGGGIALQVCAITDDGARCALEYNCIRWGSYDLTPQGGIMVFERGAVGLLAAVRIYDDVEAPGILDGVHA
jgi:SnoaL-like domain